MNRQEAHSLISEAQDHFSLDLDKRRADFEATHGKGIEHEFQALGRELEPIYGKRIWAVFTLPKGTEANVRRAHEICQRRKKAGNFAYFFGRSEEALIQWLT